MAEGKGALLVPPCPGVIELAWEHIFPSATPSVRSYLSDRATSGCDTWTGEARRGDGCEGPRAQR